MPSRSREYLKPRPRPATATSQAGERLQKVLAAAGVGSRRDCEELIAEGRVEIDRQVVRELGTRVEADAHEIRVDGVTLASKRRVYYVVNKPEGVVTTNRDPDGRPRVIDLIRSDERLFAVGRLDMSSEGLILVTNDGELANKMAHPRYGVTKTYVAKVAGEPSHDMLEKLKAGVHLAEGVARVAEVKMRKRNRQTSELEIVLNEGKNREIRRLLAAVGHKVLRLKRVAIGPLRLGEMPTGAYRQLSPDEVRHLEKFLKEGASGRRKSAKRGERAPDKRASLGEGNKANSASGERPARRTPSIVASKRPVRRPDVKKQGAVLTFDERPPRKSKPTGQGGRRVARPLKDKRKGRP